jgi:stage V sporulation protein S
MGTNGEDFVVEQVADETVLRVKNSSHPASVASALSHALYDNRKVSLRAIGAGSVNQAIKACAIARGYCAQRGFDILVKPGFTMVKMPDGEELSAIVLTIVTY